MIESSDIANLISYSIGNLTDTQIKLIHERGGDVKPLPTGGFTFSLSPEHLTSKNNGGIREDLGLVRVSLSKINAAKEASLKQAIPHLTLEKTEIEGSYIATCETQYKVKLRECLGLWKALARLHSEKNIYETMMANVGGGNVVQVEKFFQEYPIVNFVSEPDAETALMMAIAKGYAPIVNYLLQKDANVLAIAKITEKIPIDEDTMSILHISVEDLENNIVSITPLSAAFAQKDTHPHGSTIWQMLVDHAKKILFVKVSNLDLTNEDDLRNHMLTLVSNDSQALAQALRKELVEPTLTRLKIHAFLTADIGRMGQDSPVQQHFFKSGLFDSKVLSLIFSHFTAKSSEEQRTGFSSRTGKRKVH